MEQQPSTKNTKKAKKGRRSHSIMSRILHPVVIALLVQAGLFSANIIWGGTLEKLNHNAFDILNGQVVNRRDYLENEMLQRWSNLNPAAHNIRLLFDRQAEQGAASGNARRNELLLQSAPDLLALLRRNSVTGVFLILTEGEPHDEAARMQKHALYIRDMDPTTSSADNSDLLLLHAPTLISKQLDISLDSRWQSYISFSQDEPDNWLYYSKPYAAALGHPEIGEEDLGYWSPAFRAEGDSLDAITYSMPLRDAAGTVRAVLGVEISTDYLRKQMPYQELNSEKQGMYLLGLARKDEPAFEAQLATGPVYRYFFGEPNEMRFLQWEEYTNAYQVAGDTAHRDGVVYGCIQYLDLYNTNTPFENERWALIGMLEQEQLLGFSSGMMWSFLLILGVSVLLGLGVAWVASIWLTHPITRLLRQLRGNEPRSPLELDKLMISEIDELSRAIEGLSARVALEASRLSQIINISGVEIGAFEALPREGRVFCTARFFEMLGIEKELAEDGTIDSRTFDALLAPLLAQAEEETEGRDTKILRIAREQEETRWLRLNIARVDGRVTGVISDITEEILKRRQLERERDYDPLTDLPNRRAFSAALAKLFQDPDSLGVAALVMLDLDNLKFINDSHGHDCGDAYIRSTADALRKYAPAHALIARMSGDEFYVFFFGYASREAAQADICRLKEGLRQSTFPLPDETRLNIRASAGVAWYPEHSTSYEKLLKYADFAMYQVKNTTKGEFGEFDLERYSQDSFLLQNQEEINRLIEQELLTYHFQPIVDAKQGTVFGYEALMRPLLESIKSPSKLLMLAKSQSKLYSIERLTWRRSLAQFEALQNVDPEARLFVNSIANQLLAERDCQYLKERFAHMLPRVVMEITEAEHSTESETRIKLERAADWGCRIALDDFGTGYNSDAALLSINPDFVKLDVSFVRNIDTDANRRKLLQNLRSYADTRGIYVIAEGVETADELHTLIELGVDYVQGYYIARPKPHIEPLPAEIVREIRETYAAIPPYVPNEGCAPAPATRAENARNQRHQQPPFGGPGQL